MPHLRCLSFSIAVLLFGFAAHAQVRESSPGTAPRSGPPPAGQRAEGPRRGPPTRELANLLGLNAQQTEALDAVLRERRQQMQAMHQREEAQREVQLKASDDRLRKLLTPAQYGKFKQWEAERRPPPHGPQRRGKEGGSPLG